MNKTQRILAEIVIGVGLITSATLYKDEIRGIINDGKHPKAEEITKKINLKLEERLAPNPNFLNLPSTYRANGLSLQKYQNWIDRTLEDSKKNQNYAIIVDKAAYTLNLYKNGEKVEQFPIELGANPIDDKLLEGDMATPEGIYNIKKVKNIGQTSFHRAYLINYPNETDKKEFVELQERGDIPSLGTSPGSLIEIHGNGSKDERNNWTWGCIALSNENIDKLFKYNLGENTPITIVRYGTKSNY